MRKLPILSLLAILLLLAGCTPSPPAYAPPESRTLTVFTSHKEELYRPIIREFEERTGIWVEVVTGGTAELLERIAAGETPDVMFGGGAESLEAYRDWFTPYVSAQAGQFQSQFQGGDGSWTPFSALPVVLIYNPKLVSSYSLTGWADLTRPEFRGKIAFADPGVSGSSFTSLVTWLYARGGDSRKALEELAQCLDGRLLASSGDVLTAVSNGEYLVGITLEETALTRIRSGDDIALVYPADGTSCVADGCALVKRAPHPESARLFLDFTVSAAVQEMLASQFYRRPVRSDVSAPEGLPPLSRLRIVDYDVGYACENRDGILSEWQFLTGEDAP